MTERKRPRNTDAISPRLRCPKDVNATLRLQQELLKRGWSLYRLARVSRVSYNTIRAIVDEERRPLPWVQHRITGALLLDPGSIWDIPVPKRRAA